MKVSHTTHSKTRDNYAKKLLAGVTYQFQNRATPGGFVSARCRPLDRLPKRKSPPFTLASTLKPYAPRRVGFHRMATCMPYMYNRPRPRPRRGRTRTEVVSLARNDERSSCVDSTVERMSCGCADVVERVTTAPPHAPASALRQSPAGRSPLARPEAACLVATLVRRVASRRRVRSSAHASSCHQSCLWSGSAAAPAVATLALGRRTEKTRNKTAHGRTVSQQGTACTNIPRDGQGQPGSYRDMHAISLVCRREMRLAHGASGVHNRHPHPSMSTAAIRASTRHMLLCAL